MIVTLTLAIGVNSAVFSLLDGFLLRTLPYPHAERIGVLMTHVEATNPRNGQLVSEEDDSQDGATWEVLKSNLSAVTLASWGGSGGVNLQAGAAAGNAVRYVHEGRISARYFDVLGVPLYLGRSFTEQEDHPGGPQAVVLSYALWQSAFHGDSGIIGQTVQLKGESYTVVGVLAAQGGDSEQRRSIYSSAASHHGRVWRKQLWDYHASQAGCDFGGGPRYSSATYGRRNSTERERYQKILVSVLCSATLRVI